VPAMNFVEFDQEFNLLFLCSARHGADVGSQFRRARARMSAITAPKTAANRSSASRTYVVGHR
jgi:hypothetical protein